MRGGVRVCVATVAFGLGVDKGDVRGVVHYEMAKSVEVRHLSWDCIESL